MRARFRSEWVFPAAYSGNEQKFIPEFVLGQVRQIINERQNVKKEGVAPPVPWETGFLNPRIRWVPSRAFPEGRPIWGP